MQTQITCPRCQTPFVGEVHQIVDVGLEPDVKQLFLSGYLNAAECPSCNTITQIATPLLYHDPDHELFLVYVPIELNLQHTEQEKIVGQLVQGAMDRLPPEQRNGYMLQPQVIISMQTLIEKVLETEGITREMIEHQQNQSSLLQELLAADGEYQTELIDSRKDEVDQTFFAILRASLERAESINESETTLGLINLQAKLYRQTPYGQKLENQQQALHAFSREVKKEGQISPKLLLKHVLANRNDDEIVEALIVAGQQAFNYEFFVQLSNRIEKRQKSGIDAEELIELRTKLLALQDELQRQSQEIISGIQAVLGEILTAEDRRKAVQSNLRNIDSTFLNILSSMYAESRRRGDKKTADDLEEIQDIIVEEMENQAPPEIRLVNQLLRTENEEEQLRLLGENESLVTTELRELTASISADAERSGDKELAKRASKVERMVKAQLQD
jgi:hypothetical protein